jgi:Ca-activated chloride channel family protein
MLALAASNGAGISAQQQEEQEGFRFRSAVELVNVTATVTDQRGRFVPNLQKEDFAIYEDGRLQTVTHFSNERVPVSLGIAVDTSGSMAGEKIESARTALERFLFDLLDPADEIFLYRFNNNPILVQDWTTDRTLLGRALGRLTPNGGTAMYDTVAEAVPLAQAGQHQKKALVVISDGNDTSSSTDVRSLKQLIRETEVLVYAIGIDGAGQPSIITRQPRMPLPIPLPFPIPGRRQPFPFPPGGGRGPAASASERVNVSALRELTDDSGGRTEIVRGARDLTPATAGIADELSKQYYLGYQSNGARDGRWHEIRVSVRGGDFIIRARKGYIAS